MRYFSHFQRVGLQGLKYSAAYSMLLNHKDIVIQ